ncbi:MAG: biotin carboxylase N-terminal domain-containing protein [Dietzia sp.]|uniref:biotin carboxylase n=2 Tax=Dietzia maris TaxID=37915 RepID=A0A365P750_9ACTN|nr:MULTISPECIES: biotin carboxylase N-terminal domain-containing protein [Dietzia]MBB0992583.1 ATP-grasp domain-containing protein [Dietzia sp. SLG510A3-30A2]MBB0993809.1 ATP-grasp domain-containing protein [Dietzia sp. SLG510A3-40A3]MBB1010495.1 ATP-grasp domain-containing protein [Dietzia sp. SLG510A3-3B2-2]MBB1018799.1 ATP-grasp domain-containing protein [Dietzia sp. DQ11-71]MBB1052668.1 ATP-grasp domain-containing protein [Dietzia sp. CW19]ODQ94147.1 acetyl/propionyl-CoA carboxylase subui
MNTQHTPVSTPSASTATTVLVANRGEIARRIFATCRRRGLGTIAVFSDADADSPFVTEADAAVRLPGSTPTDTYLRGDLIIKAALAAGADAIHPGYGFLSESAGFAREVRAAGLIWIGPTPESIDLMGSKVESKRIMAEAGVPVLGRLDPASITEAELPVLIKASSGGGGRGMRIVRDLANLPAELSYAAREAASAFGDDTVFCERYIEAGRHIEVQVMADMHGSVWAVGERECSIQRRHQKVIEEAPSPLVEQIGAAMRARLYDAARTAAESIGYVGAGTVEFLADNDGEFFFLEMNTRLQVEHPVTECTTGLDLVSLQIDVANGEPLSGGEPATVGHSIEARLYAEDPARDWQPQAGPVHRFLVQETATEFAVLTSPGLRLDSGVVDGDEVGVHYDPMLAKVISFAHSRPEAARILATALARAQVHGLRTNRDLLVRTLLHPAFLAGEIDTAFFDRHGLATLAAPLASLETERLAAIAAAIAVATGEQESAPMGIAAPLGWRNVGHPFQSRGFRTETDEYEIKYRLDRSGIVLAPGSVPESIETIHVVSASPTRVRIEVDGVVLPFDVARYGGGSSGANVLHVDTPRGAVALCETARFIDPAQAVAEGSLLAPMPGAVIRVAVKPGDLVEKGQPILWIEAMKMEHSVTAAVTGEVSEVLVSQGDQVEVDAPLAVITASDEEAEAT